MSQLMQFLFGSGIKDSKVQCPAETIQVMWINIRNYNFSYELKSFEFWIVDQIKTTACKCHF